MVVEISMRCQVSGGDAQVARAIFADVVNAIGSQIGYLTVEEDDGFRFLTLYQGISEGEVRERLDHVRSVADAKMAGEIPPIETIWNTAKIDLFEN